jgi:hypothetical protein
MAREGASLIRANATAEDNLPEGDRARQSYGCGSHAPHRNPAPDARLRSDCADRVQAAGAVFTRGGAMAPEVSRSSGGPLPLRGHGPPGWGEHVAVLLGVVLMPGIHCRSVGRVCLGRFARLSHKRGVSVWRSPSTDCGIWRYLCNHCHVPAAVVGELLAAPAVAPLPTGRLTQPNEGSHWGASDPRRGGERFPSADADRIASGHRASGLRNAHEAAPRTARR